MGKIFHQNITDLLEPSSFATYIPVAIDVVQVNARLNFLIIFEDNFASFLTKIAIIVLGFKLSALMLYLTSL